MKNIFSFTQGLNLSNTLWISLKEKLKKLTMMEGLWCLAAGLMARGSVFGLIQPYGLALYAACSESVAGKVLMAIFIFTGCVTRGGPTTALKQIAALLVYEWFRKLVSVKKQEEDHLINAFLLGGAIAVAGMIVFLFGGKTVETLLITVLEVVLASALASVLSLTFKKKESTYMAEHRNLKLLGTLLPAGMVLSGLSGIELFGVGVDYLAAGIGILMFTRILGPGFGACAGAIAGMALSSGIPGALPDLLCIYTIAGMTVGLLQKSKAAAGTGFLLIQIIFLFILPEVYMGISEMILPVVLFFILPDIKTAGLRVLKNRMGGETTEPERLSRMKQVVSERLSDLSLAFYRMGHVVEKQIHQAPEDGKERCDSMIEQLTESVCHACPRAVNCWGTHLFHTYKLMSRLVGSLQEENEEADSSLRQQLSRFCMKPSVVIDHLLRLIEIKRIESLWQGVVHESRTVIPEQIYCLSEIIAGISGELLQTDAFFEEEEKEITALLRKQNYPVIKTEVQRRSQRRFSVEIKLGRCRGYKNCRVDIEKLVSRELGLQMRIQNESCKGKGRESCILCLKERESFNVITGVAQMKKEKSALSGDCFSFFKTREGTYAVVVSDGMGSGPQAGRFSEAAIGLFEQLLDCGLTVRRALSLVNMMLQVKDSEKYTTMDVSSIDLYTGETEFYKMGAVPGLIVSGRGLDRINMNSLPAGLLRENLIHPEKRKVKEGDYIIMMTDGVYDGLNGDTENHLEEIITRKNTLNPQEMAEYILAHAVNAQISDDMTVLVAKLWKKTG